MKTIILAGGFGTRLSEYTETIPKPMVEVNNKPILEKIMNIYVSYGLDDFYLALGYKSEFISSFFTRLVNFFNMGSSTAFYTKLSQRPKEKSLVSFYALFCLTITVVMLLFVFLSNIFRLNKYLWPEQILLFIYP